MAKVVVTHYIEWDVGWPACPVYQLLNKYFPALTDTITMDIGPLHQHQYHNPVPWWFGSCYATDWRSQSQEISQTANISFNKIIIIFANMAFSSSLIHCEWKKWLNEILFCFFKTPTKTSEWDFMLSDSSINNGIKPSSHFQPRNFWAVFLV